MRAALCSTYGEPEVIAVTDIDRPPLGTGEVRVRVHIGAINFPDLLVIANTYQMSAPLPFVTGSEFAGVVGEVGDGVTGLTVGQRVFGSCFIGAFADEVVVGAGALTAIPDDVDDRVAAAFGVAYKTAYHVLRSVADLQPGEELIVLGAGGGVGSAAVQLGAAMGATVTAVASSPEKLEAAKACGASRLIDHRADDLRGALREALPGGADVVIDPVGGDLAEPALRALHYGGRFVTVGYAGGAIPRIPLNLVLLKGIHILGFQFRDFAMHQPEAMVRNDRELLALRAAGRAAPLVGAEFDLADVVAALRHVADGRAVGKVLLRVTPPG
jgi:NADPH2:quinone reductase